MKKSPYLTKPLQTLIVGKKSIAALLDEMAHTGFQGKKLGQAAIFIQ